MPLSTDDFQRIANLAKLQFAHEQGQAVLQTINRFFALVERMDAVDTSGTAPLYHPLSAVQDVTLRLQGDVPLQGDGQARRAANLQNAPDAQDGFFLVPKVIE